MTTVETQTHSPPSRKKISKQRLEHYETEALCNYYENTKIRASDNTISTGITLKYEIWNKETSICLTKCEC